MLTEPAQNAVLEELLMQRGVLGDRALQLAAKLGEANARIAELERELEALKTIAPENVVEMPAR